MMTVRHVVESGNQSAFSFDERLQALVLTWKAVEILGQEKPWSATVHRWKTHVYLGLLPLDFNRASMLVMNATKNKWIRSPFALSNAPHLTLIWRFLDITDNHSRSLERSTHFISDAGLETNIFQSSKTPVRYFFTVGQHLYGLMTEMVSVKKHLF